jgi:predicted phosphodiesterase
MKRVAALYDIHGNLPALEAVLDEIRRDPVDLIVAGGDVIVGPMSHEALACLVSLDIHVRFIRGNCEVAVIAERDGRGPGVPAQARDAIRWTARQLTDDDARVVAAWPMTLRIDVPGLGTALFCHATPRNENECFTRQTSDAALLPIFTGLDAAVVVCGHTHMQFDRTIGAVRVVNAGSVGMPFGEPGAYWLRLGPGVELRRTSYDLDHAADRIGATSYPDAAAFAAQYIMRPPSEATMLGVFAKAELKS